MTTAMSSTLSKMAGQCVSSAHTDGMVMTIALCNHHHHHHQAYDTAVDMTQMQGGWDGLGTIPQYISAMHGGCACTVNMGHDMVLDAVRE